VDLKNQNGRHSIHVFVDKEIKLSKQANFIKLFVQAPSENSFVFVKTFEIGNDMDDLDEEKKEIN